MRKIIFITFTILLIAIIAMLIWWGYGFFQEAPVAETPTLVMPNSGAALEIPDIPILGGEETQVPEITAALEDAFFRVSDEEIIGYWQDATANRFYLVNILGQVLRLQNNKLEPITTQEIININEVKISADSQKALISFGYPAQQVFSVFDTREESWTPLPGGTIAAAWHPENSREIIYINDSRLRIFNLESGVSQTVLNINLVDALIHWPESNKVLIGDRPTAKNDGVVLEINLDNKMVKKSELVISGATLPLKCTRADSEGNRKYCAVPKEIPSNILWPDDYLKRVFYSDDSFYLIYTDQDGKKVINEVYSNLGIPIDATNLQIIEDRLYFINRYDKKLYSLYIGL